jgi:hypothetical protein
MFNRPLDAKPENHDMKTLFSIFVMCVFLMPTAVKCEELKEPYCVELYESDVAEIGKKITIEITNQDFLDCPKWNGGDPDKLPVSAKQAIAKAQAYLVKLGCNIKNYSLMECAIVREHQEEEPSDWHWKIVFADFSFRMWNAKPLIFVPVLLNGTIPKPKIEKLADDNEGKDKK